MAKAITKIQHFELSEDQKRRMDLDEVESALLNNKDAILQSLDVIKHMHDRGVLALLSGLFSEGDRVLNVLVKAADKPESTNTLKNLLLMVGVLGTINVQQLEPLLLVCVHRVTVILMSWTRPLVFLPAVWEFTATGARALPSAASSAVPPPAPTTEAQWHTAAVADAWTCPSFPAIGTEVPACPAAPGHKLWWSCRALLHTPGRGKIGRAHV